MGNARDEPSEAAYKLPEVDMSGFMREWSKHENAPRTPCPECHFESSEGYPPSHAPGCSLAVESDG